MDFGYIRKIKLDKNKLNKNELNKTQLKKKNKIKAERHVECTPQVNL